MTAAPNLESWNFQVLMLVQSLLGAVSPNFRMVTLGHDGKQWRLRFFLEEDSPEDREEIEDAVSEFEALQQGGIHYDIEVLVTSEPIPWPSMPERVIFRRRESSTSTAREADG